MIQQDLRSAQQRMLPLPLLRGAAALALAAYVAYIPFHVLTEPHFAGAFAAAELEESHHEPVDDHDHDRPHSVAAHVIHALVRSDFTVDQVLITTAAVVFFPPSVIAARPYVAQRIKPSSQSPPERIQPRAPPLL